MTNEQLAVLLRHYAMRLSDIIRTLEASLPNDIPRHKPEVMLNEQKQGRPMCLDELVDLCDMAWRDVHTLEDGKGRHAA